MEGKKSKLGRWSSIQEKGQKENAEEKTVNGMKNFMMGQDMMDAKLYTNIFGFQIAMTDLIVLIKVRFMSYVPIFFKRKSSNKSGLCQLSFILKDQDPIFPATHSCIPTITKSTNT